jgi:hypothetical protein
MSTQAQSILNKFYNISQNSTAPAATDSSLPPVQFQPLVGQSLEEILNGIPDSLLPPLALADGLSAFAGDATSDWFYPGRSLRSGTLPELDLV